MSQGPVREALRDLEQLGCVVHEPGRGCSVRAFSAEELLEIPGARGPRGARGARGRAHRMAELASSNGSSGGCAPRHAAATRTTSRRPTRPSTRRSTYEPRATRRSKQWRMLEPYSRTYLTVSRPGIDLVHLRTATSRCSMLRRGDSEAAAEAMHEHLMGAAALLTEEAVEAESSTCRCRSHQTATFPRVPPPALAMLESHEQFAERIGAAEHGVGSLTAHYLVVADDHVGTHCDARKHIVPDAAGPRRSRSNGACRTAWCSTSPPPRRARHHGRRGRGRARPDRLRAQGARHRPHPHGGGCLQRGGALPHRPQRHDRRGHEVADRARRPDDGHRRDHLRSAGLGDVRARAVLGGPSG